MPSRLTKIFAPLALAVLLLSSCAIQSPQARIERNPEIYKALTAKQKELVSQGQIAKGMPKPGVFLAMGHPERRGRGFKDGRDYERWDFASLRPVYTTSFYGGYGYGRGCGRGGATADTGTDTAPPSSISRNAPPASGSGRTGSRPGNGSGWIHEARDQTGKLALPSLYHYEVST